MAAVIAHFLDRDLKYQTRLLALRRHRGAHYGGNLASSIERIINEWDIGQKIGVAICDNATTNDTCLASLYPRLKTALSPFDIRHRRMRCYGHILNLVAKAFLFRTIANAFVMDADRLEQLEDQGEALRHWRRRGPVGKLHNIVKFIRASPERLDPLR